MTRGNGETLETIHILSFGHRTERYGALWGGRAPGSSSQISACSASWSPSEVSMHEVSWGFTV